MSVHHAGWDESSMMETSLFRDLLTVSRLCSIMLQPNGSVHWSCWHPWLWCCSHCTYCTKCHWSPQTGRGLLQTWKDLSFLRMESLLIPFLFSISVDPPVTVCCPNPHPKISIWFKQTLRNDINSRMKNIRDARVVTFTCWLLISRGCQSCWITLWRAD